MSLENPENKNLKITEDSSNDRELINVALEQSKLFLKARYSVENLTTIEFVRLRDIVREVLKDADEYYAEVKKDHGKNSGFGENMFKVHREAVARWLNNLYGFVIEEIPSTYIIDGYIHCKNGNEVDRKLIELKAKGRKQFLIEAYPTEEFKEFLQRIRERAH